MKSLKKLLAEMIQKIAKHTAILACGAASAYGGYQTKEPKNIYKREASKNTIQKIGIFDYYDLH